MIFIFYEKEGVSRLFVQNFCLTVPKNFVGEQFSVSENFDYRKSFLHEKGISRFCVENFCLKVPKNFVSCAFCFTKFLVSKKFMDRRGGGVSRVSVENLLSHSAEKFGGGTLLCCVSENFR